MTLGIRLGRRLMAVAAMANERFEFHDSRFVPSRKASLATGVSGYFRRVFNQAAPTVVYYFAPTGANTVTDGLIRLLEVEAAAHGIAVKRLTRSDVFDSFGVAPLRTRAGPARPGATVVAGTAGGGERPATRHGGGRRGGVGRRSLPGMATRVIGPLAYIGGKRRIANALVALIPEHTTYVEPFAGGAQVFFHKPRSKVEILNDLDDEIVNFLRVCQRHPGELTRVLRWQPASRRLFDWHRQQPPELLTDIERAARFFYLQKNGWSGKRMRRNFHRCVTKPPNYDPEVIEKRLTEAAARLSRVQIDHDPYQDILRRYDRPTTFFYCDPPYRRRGSLSAQLQRRPISGTGQSACHPQRSISLIHQRLPQGPRVVPGFSPSGNLIFIFLNAHAGEVSGVAVRELRPAEHLDTAPLSRGERRSRRRRGHACGLNI